MRKYKNIFIIAVAALMMVPSMLQAQTYGSINTYSPYSMYGIGELHTQGTLITRSFAGMGVSMRSYSDINLLNPAAHSATLSRSVLFDFGLEASNTFNRQTIDGSNYMNSYAAANFHDIAIQMPIAENLGMCISVSPYSSMGYDISTSELYTDIGLLSYTYEGGGDVTLVKVGFGWEPIKNLSVGVAMQYYWGSLSRSFTLIPYSITGNGTYYSTLGVTGYDISKIKAQFGVQWTAISTMTKNLVFGATYDLGGDLTPTYTHTVIGYGSLTTVTAEDIEERMSLVLPGQVTVGGVYQTPRLLIGLDYTYQDWLNNNATNVETSASGVDVAYNNFSTYKLGVQWTPNRNDIRKYFNRVSYRGGVRYGGYQQTFGGEELDQLAVTLGASFPLKMNGVSKIDLGLEYGKRGSDNTFINVGDGETVGLIRQDYFKVSLGFTLFGDDYWFQRPKFD